MYQQTYNQPSAQNNIQLQEQDWGNLVLSELKRTAREYTTAALEASHPVIRQTFQSLAQRTMQDQAELYTVLSQLSGYGTVKAADQQEIQQELQKQFQKAEQLQAFVSQSAQSGYSSGGLQPSMSTNYPSSQHYQQSAQTPAAYQPYYSQNQSVPTGQAQGYGQTYSQSFGQSGQSYNPSYTQSSAPGFNQSFSQAIQNNGLGFNQNTGANTAFGQGQSPGYTSASTDYSGAKGSFTSGQDYSSSLTARSSQSSIASAASQDYSANRYSSSNDAAFSKSAQGSMGSTTGARGGNSFNWSASEDNESSSTTLSSLANSSAESNGKNFL